MATLSQTQTLEESIQNLLAQGSPVGYSLRTRQRSFTTLQPGDCSRALPTSPYPMRRQVSTSSSIADGLTQDAELNHHQDDSFILSPGVILDKGYESE
jgi:hypothetical protein